MPAAHPNPHVAGACVVAARLCDSPVVVRLLVQVAAQQQHRVRGDAGAVADVHPARLDLLAVHQPRERERRAKLGVDRARVALHLAVLVCLELVASAPGSDGDESRVHPGAYHRAEHGDVRGVPVVGGVDAIRGSRAVGEESDPVQEVCELPTHVGHELQGVSAEKVTAAVLPSLPVAAVPARARPPLERADEGDVIAARVPRETPANGVRLVLLVHGQYKRVLVRHARRDGQRRG